MSKVSKKVAFVMAVSMVMGISVVPSKAEVVSSLDTAEESFFGPTSGTSDATSDIFFGSSSQDGVSAPDQSVTSGSNAGSSTTDTTQDSQPVATSTTSTTETTNSNNTYYYYYTTPSTVPSVSTSEAEKESVSYNAASQTTVTSSMSNTTLNKPQIATVVGGKRVAIIALKRAVSGADGYQIQICKSKKFKTGVTQLRTVLTTKSVTVRNGGSHYVRVRAYKVVNGKNVYSTWSTVKSVKIKK